MAASNGNLVIGYQNIYGQTSFNQSKQKQIEHQLIEHGIEIMHLQETNINEASFHYCPFINQNYNMIFQNNSSGYGVCSLVHKKLTISNEMIHPDGRLIMFDIGQVTYINLYLHSGQDFEAKNARENYISTTLPNYLLKAQKMGCLGGDFNCLDRKDDATHLAETKISTNLQN